MEYRKKPVVVEATQWNKNGDHPLDHDPIGIENPSEMDKKKYHDYLTHEGKVVRFFQDTNVSQQDKCGYCNTIMHKHGWIDTREGGHIVCPGDFIITGVKGEFYPCKPDIFADTYEVAVDTGVSLIAIERTRQIEKEGWTSSHDGNHEDDELAKAAACYAIPDRLREVNDGPLNKGVPLDWPWDEEWWKPTPKNRVRELVKAGALIAAEIDRLKELLGY